MPTLRPLSCTFPDLYTGGYQGQVWQGLALVCDGKDIEQRGTDRVVSDGPIGHSSPKQSRALVVSTLRIMTDRLWSKCVLFAKFFSFSLVELTNSWPVACSQTRRHDSSMHSAKLVAKDASPISCHARY